ncbi:LysR family transcriptional regulator [Chromobacterium sphagni]|uniref:LysR family transcriptional regulator n=1 Tax=Chromobacterium sphagni TaxID=1903179 RepID=A0A1S1WZB0_9NEIS|nr:LysR family transcriptional regulator [Chromobacterium sphagni]OHX12460.1 LysR family transcriptional regulator [Chromobacterium sphagni]
MLDDLDLFVAIVDAGSLSAAAKRHGMPAPTLTRRLQALEARLGCKLLNRSARRMVPSNEGWQYYEQCKPLLSALRQATDSLDATLNRVEGLVKVMAPVSMANGLLLPVWQRLLQRHPQVRLELLLNNGIGDVLEAGADLAIRVGPQPDSQLNQRRLGQVSAVLAAAPSYLAARSWPQSPGQLAGHDLLLTTPLQNWKLHHVDTDEPQPLPDGARLLVNDMLLGVSLAEAGCGIVLCPLSQCRRQLACGSLLRVMPDWRIPPRPVYALWPQRLALPARVRALLDILLEFAAEEPLLQA